MSLTPVELDWNLRKQPLLPFSDLAEARAFLELNYPDTANFILEQAATFNLNSVLPCFRHSGIGTRPKKFFAFLRSKAGLDSEEPAKIFAAFSDFLGRVTSYRALALDASAYERITKSDRVFPTGWLRSTPEEVDAIVPRYGIRHVAYARLYIGRRLVPLDPSLSLHDEPGTALTIAGGYLEPGKSIYLMELSLPKVECLGYRLADISDDPERRWFQFRRTWFDSSSHKTERYVLYEIPFLAERLQKLEILDKMQLGPRLEAYRVQQDVRKLAAGD
jgi:hypothetical protein